MRLFENCSVCVCYSPFFVPTIQIVHGIGAIISVGFLLGRRRLLFKRVGADLFGQRRIGRAVGQRVSRRQRARPSLRLVALLA